VRMARIARVGRDRAAATAGVVAAVGVMAREATRGPEAVAVIDSRARDVAAIEGRIASTAAVIAVEARVVTIIAKIVKVARLVRVVKMFKVPQIVHVGCGWTKTRT
jgi:hypothetical protein